MKQCVQMRKNKVILKCMHEYANGCQGHRQIRTLRIDFQTVGYNSVVQQQMELGNFFFMAEVSLL